MKSKLLQFFNALEVAGIFLIKNRKVQHVFTGIWCWHAGNANAFTLKKSFGWLIAKVVGEILRVLGLGLLCLHALDPPILVYVHANVTPWEHYTIPFLASQFQQREAEDEDIHRKFVTNKKSRLGFRNNWGD